jgi:hypothetical protein
MLDRERVDTLLDLQRRSYALLRWIDGKVQSGTLPLGSLHGALDASQAATEWLSRHAATLPADARPPEGKLPEFARLFASYLVTSFEVRPRKRVRAACGCELCAYFVEVPNLKARAPSKADRQIADELKLDCLEALAGEAGVPLFREELADILRSNAALETPLALVTYVRELDRRAEFRGQGRPVLALWREFAWKNGRPMRGFELATEKVLQAEALIRNVLYGFAS